MRPDYVIWIESGTKDRNEIVTWCLEYIGEPFLLVKRPRDGVPIGFDYTNENGKWCCHGGNYVGDNRIVDTWSFCNEQDAVLFSLRWA